MKSSKALFQIFQSLDCRSRIGRLKHEITRDQNIRARVKILLVYRADDIGARQVEQIVVAPERARHVGPLRPAIIRFRQPIALEHRPHAAVEHEDALLQKLYKVIPVHIFLLIPCFPIRLHR